jgi:hypothetical protein
VVYLISGLTPQRKLSFRAKSQRDFIINVGMSPVTSDVAILSNTIMTFYVRGSVHREIYINNCPTRCKNIQFIYICKLLYMFRVATPLIIRSSYHYIYSIWYYWDRTATCLERDWIGTVSQPDTFQTGSSTVSVMPDTADTVIWAPDDECSYHWKRVENFTNINKLYIVASC